MTGDDISLSTTVLATAQGAVGAAEETTGPWLVCNNTSLNSADRPIGADSKMSLNCCPCREDDSSSLASSKGVAAPQSLVSLLGSLIVRQDPGLGRPIGVTAPLSRMALLGSLIVLRIPASGGL